VDNNKIVDSNEFVERRVYPRFPVEYVSEVYLGSDILFTTVIDISKGGVGLRLPKGFDVGALFDLRINYKLCDNLMAKFERIDIRIMTELVWIKKIDSAYRGGLKILNIEPKGLVKLEKCLRDLEQAGRS